MLGKDRCVKLHPMSTVAKALGLLDLFCDDRPCLGLSHVQRLTGRDKATVHRHLVALEQAGFLEQDAQSRTYRLGPELTRLAGMRARTVPEVEMVRNVVDALSREVKELVHVSRLQGFDLIHVHHAEEHDHPVRVAFDAYGLPPLLATASGKAYLAFSPSGLLELALADPRTRLPGTPAPDRRALETELKRVACLGYASNRDALRLGVSSVAIPIFDGASRPFATCSIAYPTGRGSTGTEARLARLLMRRGADISAAMGGVVPPHIRKIWTLNRERATS